MNRAAKPGSDHDPLAPDIIGIILGALAKDRRDLVTGGGQLPDEPESCERTATCEENLHVTVPCSGRKVPGWVEVALVGVLIGEHNRSQGPRKAEPGIIPADAPLAFRGVELVDEIKGLGILDQGDEAVPEASGNVHHPAVVGGQLGSETLPEGGRTRAQVEDEIVKCPTDAAHQLGLGSGCKLIVHAAKRALLSAERVVNLDKAGNKLVCSELSFAKGPGEETPVVAPLFQVDQERARDGCRGEDHDGLVLVQQVKPILERAQSDELISLEVLLAKTMLDHPSVQFLHPSGEVVLELEVRQKPVEQIEIDAVVAGVGAYLAGVRDLRRGNQSLDLVAHIANLIVLGVRPNVDSLVVDSGLGGDSQCEERAGNVATVDERAPGRTIRLNANLAIGQGRTQQVVDDQINAEHR